jgi:hypothetical protein
MPGSVPRAIVELEQLREQVQDPELRQLIEVLLRLLTGSKGIESVEEYARLYFSSEQQQIFRNAMHRSS